MFALRHRLGWLTCLVLLGTISPLCADEPPDPLRLVPLQADFVARIENPRALVENFLQLGPVQDLRKLRVVQELLDSTNIRRLQQLIGYFEEKMGGNRYELLQRLTDGGVVLAVKTGGPKAPALLILQGSDSKAVQQFMNLGLEVIAEELARQDSKDKIVRKNYEGIEAAAIGDKLFVAVIGNALVLSNRGEALKMAADLHLAKGGQSILDSKELAQARQLLPKQLHAWVWFNLQTLQQAKESQAAFQVYRDQPLLNMSLFGGPVDLIQRAPFVCAGLYQQDNRYVTTVRMPRGLHEMPDLVAPFFPPEKARDNSLPLLEPPGVLFSTSYYLDPARIWEHRQTLLNEKQRADLEKFEKNSGRFLGGNKLGELLGWAGPHQRVVVAQPRSSVYKKKPNQNIPAFAVVHDMRKPEESTRAADRILRGAALLATTQFRLKLIEEDYKGIHLVSYRFPENREVAQDKENIRFAFSPTYAWVGDQFIASSTVELARDLIDVLQHEKAAKACPATWQAQMYSSGLALGLKEIEDQLVTQAVLSQALSAAEARQQFQQFLDILQHLGTLQLETIYHPTDFRLNLTLDLGKDE